MHYTINLLNNEQERTIMTLITEARAAVADYALFIAQDGKHKKFATISCARLRKISPKFDGCLNSNMTEGLHKRITVQMPKSFSRAFILFLKTGKASITCNNILGLIQAADEHRLDQLKKKCYAFIEDHFKILPKSCLRQLIQHAMLISDIRLFIVASVPKSIVSLLPYNPKMPVIRVYRPIKDLGDNFFKIIDGFGLPFELIVDNESMDEFDGGQLRNLRGFGNNNYHSDSVELTKFLAYNSKHNVTTRSLNAIGHPGYQALPLSILKPVLSHLYNIYFHRINCTTLKLERARVVSISTCPRLTQVIAKQAKSVEFHSCDKLKLIDIPKATRLEMIRSKVESVHAPSILDAQFLSSTVVEPLSLDSVETLLIQYSSIRHLNAPHAKCLTKDLGTDSQFWTCGISPQIKYSPRPRGGDDYGSTKR